jgi:hypothetical protein
MLAIGGGVLYLFDPAHFIPFTAGLVVLGAWLSIFYLWYWNSMGYVSLRWVAS